jgi:hypothetical protein
MVGKNEAQTIVMVGKPEVALKAAAAELSRWWGRNYRDGGGTIQYTNRYYI